MHHEILPSLPKTRSLWYLINALAQVFAAPEVQDMAGHLMIYPYQIDEDGAVTYLGGEMIPDTKTAKVQFKPFLSFQVVFVVRIWVPFTAHCGSSLWRQKERLSSRHVSVSCALRVGGPLLLRFDQLHESCDGGRWA